MRRTFFNRVLVFVERDDLPVSEELAQHRIRHLGGAIGQGEIRARVAEVALSVMDGMAPKVKDGDSAAAGAMLKANDQLARLGGAYAPTKQLHGIKRIEDMTEDELRDFLGGNGSGDGDA